MIPGLVRPAAMYALAVLPFTCASAPAFVTPDLTGVWASNNTGVVYYIRQLGNTVWWAALNPDMASPISSKSNSFHRGLISTQVFQGTMSGSTVTGDWADLPRQSNANLSQGTLSVSVNLDARGNVTALQPQTQTGAPTGDSWVRVLIPQPPCVDITGHRDMYCLFAKVLKNQTETIWGSRESLLDNLKPYKDNVVVFGTVVVSFKPFSVPSSCSDFFTNNVTDDDLDFVITADRANLDAQPGFWTDGWRNPASDVQGKLNAWQTPFTTKSSLMAVRMPNARPLVPSSCLAMENSVRTVCCRKAFP